MLRFGRFTSLAGALALSAALLAPVAASAQSSSNTSSTATGQSVPTNLNPCNLVTSDEASTIAGTAYGPGLMDVDDSGAGATCVYGSQTVNVFSVGVGQAPDAATAQADWATEETNALNLAQRGLPPGVSLTLTPTDITNLPGFDRAAMADGTISFQGQTINGRTIFLLKGATFVSFGDLLLNQPAPTSDAFEAEAETVLSRLP
jgi:hypothetical protein